MFFYVRIPLEARPVRTEAQFQAADPWRSNAPADFALMAYRYVPKKIKSTPPRWLWGGEEFYALRSGAKGAVHFLPASLARLWKTQRVPAASLPRLLHDLEPSLKKSDHQPRLSAPTGRKVMLIVLAFIALACVGYFQPEGTSYWKILVPVCGVIFALLIAASVMILGQARRRNRQIEWALQRLREWQGVAAV